MISEEIKEIVSARDKAAFIHGSTDIDAAGDQVEKKVRELISRRLPVLYYTGHGHIVDKNLNYNGQHDLIIADNNGSPVLFTAENGTEYFPYESVYAVAEIKSTYDSSKKPIEAFINRTSKMYQNLHRIETSPTYLSQTISFSSEYFENGEKRPYKSNVFKFMIFVDGGNFKPEQLESIYQGVDNKLLPNLIVILNRGIIMNAQVSDENNKILPHPMMKLFPEFNDTIGKPEQFVWTFWEATGENSANNLALLYFALNEHLNKCLLLRPNFIEYFANIGLTGFKNVKIISGR
ncbi:DUF6602 domain-containing protein [Hymenobacter coccineus]|uniref:DUF6602 domain-containing protein n=1 Tax=Hymenobacter coccineus TaxID=1908235 RepID=UPI00114CC0BE|nr:DUF6602 domain-containing protein [Hymenobacter coccineus]